MGNDVQTTLATIESVASGANERPLPNYLRREDAAAYIRSKHGIPCAAQWLAKLAVVGGGPEFRKAGRTPLYEPAKLDLWAHNRISKPFQSTAEYKTAGAA